jgi:putative protease
MSSAVPESRDQVPSQTIERLSKGMPTHHIQRPELLAPAGNWDCAKAAVENGADAIYFGLDRFNARMRAENFTEADLPELMAWLHRRGVKGYVTINTLVFTDELPDAERYLKSIIAAGVDAAIVQDVGLVQLIRHLSPDFPIHASTQMTITSAAGVAFARELGCQLVVLARECSIKEIQKIQAQLGDRGLSLPLEVFVHGALCVAYSGQCLTSEALGGRSANRGECAQACRMPYELLADGQVVDVGDRDYLLSPQDLSGLPVLSELVAAGVSCFKIEGRLKAPEYVASTTRIYRQALDRAMETLANPVDKGLNPLADSVLPDRAEIGRSSVSAMVDKGLKPLAPSRSQPQSQLSAESADRYELEMSFSRGLFTGWFEGTNNQALVHGEYAKKRGAYLGEVVRVEGDWLWVRSPDQSVPVRSGDGIGLDGAGGEQGGRVCEVAEPARSGRRGADLWGLRVDRFSQLDLRRVRSGDRVWKTSDPDLEKRVRQTYAGDQPKFQRPITIEFHGAIGQPATAIARDEAGHIAQVDSTLTLAAAERQPLTSDRLRDQLGRLGNTPFCLGELTSHLKDPVILPASELNRMRRELVAQLEQQRSQPPRWTLRAEARSRELCPPITTRSPEAAQISVLVRNQGQLAAAIASGIQQFYCELEDPRQYRAIVDWFRANKQHDQQVLFVAPPRIYKTGETWILQQVRNSNADGYLVRNYDQLAFFADQPCAGDFALNVANPITARYFKTQFNLRYLTASYDLNGEQLTQLLTACPTDWLEVTIHQHMPMFHMEHCVFCAFLSDGTDHTNCGRPCEDYAVRLRDRTGVEHVLQADAGCRNTLFNGVAQTGAEVVQRLMAAGGRRFRVEFLDESPDRVRQSLTRYQQLLRGEISGVQLWQDLQLASQLGVTRGTIGQRERSRPGRSTARS